MATLTVGTGAGFAYATLSSAIVASKDGDLIQVQAGNYTNDFATITTSITVEGVGGMVNLVATIPPPNLQGILTIGTPGGGSGPTVTLYNMAFSGAAISNTDGGNAAGIRYKSGDLTLNNTFFHGNQEGLLADADPTGRITINNSEFAGNGNANPPGSGIEHNLYVGAIAQLTINGSLFTDPIVGHNIKSRAAQTTIRNSRIDDPNGTGSYEIDLPNGGVVELANTVIEKGPGAGNSNFVSFGEEGNLAPGSALSVTGSTISNDYGQNGHFIINQTGIPVSVTGNTLYGLNSSQIISGPVASPEANTLKPHDAEPALDLSAPYLPVIPFSFACFAAGTCILTADGDVPVEALRVGQSAISARGGTPRPIRWIGYLRLDLTLHQDPRAARPICIRAGAFADTVPARDLLLSPDHAIHVEGILIPVRLLQNGATILRDDAIRSVQYFHIELDRHDILLAEGLAAESYLDTGNRGSFENPGMPTPLHAFADAPSAQPMREAMSCAPFRADAASVEPVWRRLAARAARLGHVMAEPETTGDPSLRLLVDGTACRALPATAGCLRFAIPPNTAAVRLVSRATAPCDLRPWVEDQRALGVAIGRIVLLGATDPVVVLPDDPGLTHGWWATERDASRCWRWTTGNAVVALPAGVTIIEVHLSGETEYGLGPDRRDTRSVSRAATTICRVNRRLQAKADVSRVYDAQS